MNEETFLCEIKRSVVEGFLRHAVNAGFKGTQFDYRLEF